MSSAEPGWDPAVDDGPAAVDGYRWQRWRIPTTASSLWSFRRWLSAVLDDTGLGQDDAYDLLLAVGEAVSNAIEHAQRPARPYVDVIVEVTDGRVTIVVRDHGQWRDGPSGPHRGRGLAMMSAVAETTVRTAAHGTTVTIRSPVPGG